MSEKREPKFDRAVAMVLRTGSFAAFFVMLSGVVAHIAIDGNISNQIELAGVLIMLATPILRVIVAMVLFFYEKDWRYGWISAGVLAILLLGSVFGIGEH
jgi:uncharacterized membrane protein